jgi:hypothetical protein
MNGLGAHEGHSRTTGAGVMIAQSVADILGQHVKLSVEGIDRMYLNLYVPRLQIEQGVVGFFREHRGQPLPSAALMSPMSRNFVAKLEGFVAEHEVPLVQFRRGQRKDVVMAEHLGKFSKEEGVVFVGKAQEKTPVFRKRYELPRPPGGYDQDLKRVGIQYWRISSTTAGISL